MSVLLLNATYEPIRIISLRRAVVLVVTDKAEIVEERNDRFRSARTSVPVPTVVRLKYFVQIPYRARLPLNRRAVLRRDNHTCAYCGKHADTMDHVVPRARGGRHSWENVVAACRRCNNKKGDRSLADLGWTLDRKPFAPTGTFWLVLGVVEVDDAWKPYLESVAA